MIAFLLSPIGKAAGVLLVGTALMSGVYAYAYSRGSAAERQAILERSVDLLRERNETDEKIHSMDNAELCAALGGWMSGGTCQ